MTNRPMKKTSVATRPRARNVGASMPRDQQHHAGAEQGDNRRLEVQRRSAGRTPTITPASTTRQRTSSRPSRDGRSLLERHHLGDLLGVVLEATCGTAPGRTARTATNTIDHDRRHVDQEVVERQPGPAADDDVRRVADQRGGAADVGGEHLCDQVGLRRDPEPVADHDRDRRDQHDRGHVVEERRGDRGDDHQHDHQPVRAGRGPLGRPDRRGTRRPRSA